MVKFEGTDTMLLPSFCCFVAQKPGRSKEAKVKDLIIHKAITLLSMADQALQDASGTRAPIKCFGCGELHQFKDGPRKETSASTKRSEKTSKNGATHDAAPTEQIDKPDVGGKKDTQPAPPRTS
jgi:hypothetical protein